MMSDGTKTPTVSVAQIAMLRGVRNCGRHHEENVDSPAVWFAKECDGCVSHIFAVIWNAGVAAQLEDALRHVRNFGR